MKRILIFGTGYIGNKLQKYLNCDISDKRIFQTQDVIDEIEKYKPDVIINCIGYTGESNIDDCDKDVRRINKTIVLNTFIPILFLEASYRTGVKLVHISSGCIYNYDYAKDIPIRESKKPNYFKLYYSRSKIYAERVLEKDALILRIRIPLDNEPSPKNILDKLIRYKKVIDVPNSVTYIPDFVKAVKYLIEEEYSGVFNVLNKGGLKYQTLLEEYRKYIPTFKYELIGLESLKLNRTNMIMDTTKLESTGFQVREIEEVIPECIKEYLSRVDVASLEVNL